MQAAEAADEQVVDTWQFGTELDVLPFLLDGYYLSATAGRDHWRIRYVRTNVTAPEFATASGFDNNRLEINAVILDYFFDAGKSGWWVGPGIERWQGKVTEESSGLRQSYRTDMLTLGGGYVYYVSERVFLNPWVAIHIPVSGDRDVMFVDDNYELRILPEASVKLGIRF
ncbi:MAG: hypothetical protein IPM20_02170 [Gammaproteobacteria bacterium]|nr:hypothetical protein [Gammaproteobacteria bacterium]